MSYLTSQSAVFSAPTRLRLRIVHGFLSITISAVLAVLGQFSFAVYSVDNLEPVGAPHVINLSITASGTTLAPKPMSAREWVYDTGNQPDCSTGGSISRRQIMAFLPAADPAARTAVMRHCGQIDLLFEDAYSVSDADGSVRLLSSAPIHGLGTRTLPILKFSQHLSDETVAAILSDPAKLSGLALRLGLLNEGPRAGLCLDMSARPEISSLLIEAAVRTLIPEGKRCVIGSADALFWNDRPLVDALDHGVALVFRTSNSPATPPASKLWFSDMVDRASRLIDSDKLVFGVGTRGQIWRSGASGVDTLPFVEAMATISAAGAAVTYITWANAVKSRYVDTSGVLNEIWAVDALSVHKQLERIGPETAVAVWPIGAEDPAIWDVLKDIKPIEEILSAPIDLDSAVQMEGEGIVIVSAEPLLSGSRSLIMDDHSKKILSETYQIIPAPARLVRHGQQDAAIVMSFGDLPPVDIWPELFGILDESGVEATFLVSQRELIDKAEMAQRIVAAGHTLGLKEPHRKRPASLLNEITERARQLLIADRTGVRPRLVEAGEVGDWSGQVRQADQLIRAGYVPVIPVVAYGPNALETVTEEVPTHWFSRSNNYNRIAIRAGPQDWNRVLTGLPPLLGGLHDKGYQFLSVREVAGLTLDQAMPVAIRQPQVAAKIVFAVAKFMQNELNVIFVLFLIYSAARSLIYLMLAIARRPKREFNPVWTPPLTVLIPAFNEEKVIESCIRSILGSAYPDLRVIVVDDGSTDATFDVVTRGFGNDPKVTVLRQANGGKWAAANYALEEMETPFFLIADADSVFTPETIGWLVQQFQDESIGAVAGIVEVGNRDSWLGSCQALEYIVSQSIIRRAQEVFDGILVVPGAVGAWRTAAVRKAGLFSGNTVTEDADLTVAVHRAGYRVVFQEQARSVTEAPASARDFMRQRLRWTFGMLQTSWKHRGAIAEGRTVGYISIVDAIWFGVLSSLLAPLVDLFLVVLLVQGIWAIAANDVALIASVPPALVLAYFALTALDVINALVAFWFEKRFDWWLLFLVPFLRFGYRQLLYISTIRALLQAMTGTVAHWNKLDRTGNVLSFWSPAKKNV